MIMVGMQYLCDRIDYALDSNITGSVLLRLLYRRDDRLYSYDVPCVAEDQGRLDS